ncbi:hypothetical protein RC92_06560 [Pectobacterium brasiliense]|nr:hypothetical protein RC79_06615 [Pectobacterium brasiliense]KHT09779.1 hypothetical protein RC92_06560 [Pectobacterium brasiliense]
MVFLIFYTDKQGDDALCQGVKIQLWVHIIIMMEQLIWELHAIFIVPQKMGREDGEKKMLILSVANKMGCGAVHIMLR